MGDLVARAQARLADIFPDRQQLKVTRLDIPSGAGVNNETYMLDVTWSANGAPATASLVLRVQTENDLHPWPPIRAHFRLYELMGSKRIVPVPQVFGLDDSASVFGQPSFFMQRIEGQIPNDQPVTYHQGGWVAEKASAQRTLIWQRAVDAMAAVHATPLQEVNFLQRPERGATGFEQELRTSFDYAEMALEGQAHPIIDAARDWLVRYLPSTSSQRF
jgi:aminoglycoside phosphotransferase (APT) family kinase protein